MAVTFRLQRWGKKKAPYYFVVVADSRKPRNGRYLEKVGTYKASTEPSEISLNHERIKHWYGVGARPSDAVKNLFKADKVELT